MPKTTQKNSRSKSMAAAKGAANKRAATKGKAAKAAGKNVTKAMKKDVKRVQKIADNQSKQFKRKKRGGKKPWPDMGEM